MNAEPGAVAGVSVIAAVRDEERHLGRMVSSVLDQEYAGPMELIIALGPSSDRTEQVARALAAADVRIKLVVNPTGRTPNGLNAALAEARHPLIVRVDGHAQISPDYVQIAVATLERTGADNVGGIMAAAGETIFERAVACAMTSRLGVGAAAFHVGGEPGPAETVYLGCFRRSALDRVGGFDERFTRAQDWELNHRIRLSGGLVWFTPELRVRYRPRSSVSRLARQYFDYGTWRREVMRRHPETRRSIGALRYLAAPLAVLLLIVGSAAGVAGALGAPAWLNLGWAALIGYLALVVVGGWLIGARAGASGLLVPMVLGTMHLSWGTGFLLSRRLPGSGTGSP